MVGPMPACPVCADKMISAYILRNGNWVKVGYYCLKCEASRSLDCKVIVV